MTVIFRGLPACECLAEWLPYFERELIGRGVVKVSIDLYQLIGTAPKSANTHKGGAFDIAQIGREVMWVARQMGAPATWDRTTGTFAGEEHTHGVLYGCPHLHQEARDQIRAVFAGGDGLVGDAPDHGPRPIPRRTWREGIAWHREQELRRKRRARLARLRLRRKNITATITKLKELLHAA